jgi:hypothetical protein
LTIRTANAFVRPRNSSGPESTLTADSQITKLPDYTITKLFPVPLTLSRTCT